MKLSTLLVHSLTRAHTGRHARPTRRTRRVRPASLAVVAGVTTLAANPPGHEGQQVAGVVVEPRTPPRCAPEAATRTALSAGPGRRRHRRRQLRARNRQVTTLIQTRPSGIVPASRRPDRRPSRCDEFPYPPWKSGVNSRIHRGPGAAPCDEFPYSSHGITASHNQASSRGIQRRLNAELACRAEIYGRIKSDGLVKLTRHTQTGPPHV
jgi:hypothetical protein